MQLSDRYPRVVAFSFALLAIACTSTSSPSPVAPIDDASAPEQRAPTPVETVPAPPVCAPAEVTAFVPRWTTPAPLHRDTCKRPDLVSFTIGCLVVGSKPAAGCEGTDYEACRDCLVAGPIIVEGGIARLNVAGCIANVMGDPAGSKCGQFVANAEDCAHEACRACFETERPRNDYETCRTAALAAGPCAEHAVSARNCQLDAVRGNPEVALCLGPGNFGDRAERLGNLFCLAESTDAGAADASAD